MIIYFIVFMAFKYISLLLNFPKVLVMYGII